MNSQSFASTLFQVSSSRNKRLQFKLPFLLEPVLGLLVLLLIGFSLVMVYSTTAVMAAEKYGDAYFFVKRQAMAALLGLIFFHFIAFISLDFLKKCAPYFLISSLLLLLLTYIPFIGDRAGGAQRWLNLGFIRFQPGEMVKLLFIISLAGYLDRHDHELSRFKFGVVKPLLFLGCVCALFLKQPDFGSSAIVAIVTIAMILAAGARIAHFGVLALLIALPAVLLVIFSPYRLKRVTTFLSPLSDPSGSGYQLIQSLIAVSSGGIAGLGLGGSQQKLFFLPAAHTDFIFAVISEELGFIGALAVMFCFLLILWRGIRIAGRVANDTFSFTLTIGATLLIVVPALLNMGVVTGMLPTKGMVLPLIGYGGTNLVASLSCVGFLYAVLRKHSR